MKYILLASAFVVLGVVGVYQLRSADIEDVIVETSGFGSGITAVLYKSPTCGCCEGYAKEMEKQGFKVEVVSVDDMGAIKEKYGIPQDKQSCHTITIEDYVVEGHVPFEAVEKLLTERPEIEGIRLPRMPSGSPGMPGPKRSPYEVYQLSEGVFTEYVTI